MENRTKKETAYINTLLLVFKYAVHSVNKPSLGYTWIKILEDEVIISINLGKKKKQELLYKMPYLLAEMADAVTDDLKVMDKVFEELTKPSYIKAENFITESSEIVDKKFKDLYKELVDNPKAEDKHHQYMPDKKCFNIKKLFIGDKVTIGHPLFTNTLVDVKNGQLPIKHFLLPAAKEVMGLTAIVLDVNSEASYKCCNCSAKHRASIRIAFEEISMEFYVDEYFVKLVKDE